MLHRISSFIKGALASIVLVVNIVVAFSLVFPLALVKLVLPFRFVRLIVDFILSHIAETWIAVNSMWMAAVGRTRWHLVGLDKFTYKGWYLVSSNHQSWVDILVLQKVFNRKIPLLKFFIKHELIYVPLMGLAWWALDFPFMKRKGGASAKKDLETARKACEKYKVIPTSVISFMEGTRYTPSKAKEQKTPYKHLLKAKTGGVGMALETMGELFNCMLDVTIVYPKGVPTFVDLLTGNIEDVIVSVRQVEIPKDVLVNEAGEPPSRGHLQQWINGIWQAKDQEIDQLTADFKAGKLK
ncbi:MAG: acyltransferase [Aquabacterium sp.]|uniref:acyltransferase n=1 Tax=Aquabacterium sp. TaxID=1872578 RepID=UPI0011F6B006|nr:acyltransferase [Aquabacterium sp.]TAK94188.1 MAG: acyltransferase [Aquabacterium sp.]